MRPKKGSVVPKANMRDPKTNHNPADVLVVEPHGGQASLRKKKKILDRRKKFQEKSFDTVEKPKYLQLSMPPLPLKSRFVRKNRKEEGIGKSGKNSQSESFG